MKNQHFNKNTWSDKLSSGFEQLSTDQFKAQLRELVRINRNPVAIAKLIMFAIGGLLTFISFTGLVLGYGRGFYKFMKPKSELPRLHNLPFIVKVSMTLGVVFVWAVIIAFLALAVTAMWIEPIWANIIFAFVGINVLLSIPVYIAFLRWRNSVWNLMLDADKSGSARYALPDDLKEFVRKRGLFIGGHYYFGDKGHVLLVAGTRSGKSLNLLMANVLYHGCMQRSLIYIDPKGETAAVCADFLRKSGKRVVILNPFELLKDFIKGNSTYNPLALLSDKTSEHLIDDVSLIAELLVPIKSDDKNAFFTDSARSLISGLLLHLVTSDKVQDATLGTLWAWLRYSGDDWNNLLADMYVSDDPVNGQAIKMAASEIAKMMESPETYGSIVSNALTATNFLKSHSLQKSIVSGGLDPYSINDGNTVVFVVMPFDKLKSHANYLRTVVTTLLRACVRKPSNHMTTFICDEAFNLGYISEMETALSGYAGFNVSMYLVYQDLAQLSGTYGQTKWESVMANCSIRQFAGVKDVFTAEYCSKLMGDKTRLVYSQDWLGNVKEKESSHRPLATPNEVTRMSKDNIILFTGENPVTVVPKIPYYEMTDFKDVNGKSLYNLNPYIENSK